jgi:hypothetical protein
VYKVIGISQKDVDDLFELWETGYTAVFGPERDDRLELADVLFRHRRFYFKCHTREDALETCGWVFKFDANVICHTLYNEKAQEGIVEDSARRIWRMPCLKPERGNQVWLIMPGCDAAFFFYGGKEKTGDYYLEKIDEYLTDIFCGLPGVTLGRNDLLINGSKAAGFEFSCNEKTRTLQITGGLTWNADALKAYTRTFDFSKKKYSGLAGFDETGISREDFDKRVKDFYEAVKCL